MNANLQEGLSGVRVSQAFVRERRNEEEFEEVAAGYLDARLGAQRLVAIYFPFVELLSELDGRARARRRQRPRRERLAQRRRA